MTPRQSFVRRLRLGLGTLVAISVLGLVAIHGAERRAGAALEASQQALSLLDDFKQVQIELSAARAAEREFVLEDLRAPNFFSDGTSPSLEEHAEALERLEVLLARLEEEDAAGEHDVAAIRTAVREYASSFRELVSLHRERGSLYTGLLGTLRESSFTLLERVSEVDERRAAPMREQLLELMRDQSDYLRDLDNRPRFLVSQRLEILGEELDALGHSEPEELRALIDAYAGGWQKLVSMDERIGHSAGSGVRGELRRAQETVVPLTLAAVERARTRFEVATRSLEASAAMARRVTAGAAVVGGFVALAIAVVLGQGLRTSLSRVLAAVERYAGGDREARVGRLERDDEFAALGQAFDRMADTLADTTEELEEINASLNLAVKGDTEGLMKRIEQLVAMRRG